MKTIMKLLSAMIIAGISLPVLVTAQNIQGASTTGYVLKFTNTSGVTPTAGNSVMYETGGVIGVGTTTPSVKLDVNGDVNITGTKAYYIGGTKFLWNNNIGSSTFVGAGAGNTGTSNVFVGNAAGTYNTTYSDNVYVGYGCGQYNALVDGKILATKRMVKQ
jgi:trimeric autotransporter adhesin